MTHEEGFIDGDVLVGMNRFVRFDFQHPIHQQERITMRQVRENFVNVHQHGCKPRLFVFNGFQFLFQLRNALGQFRQAADVGRITHPLIMTIEREDAGI